MAPSPKALLRGGTLFPLALALLLAASPLAAQVSEQPEPAGADGPSLQTNEATSPEGDEGALVESPDEPELIDPELSETLSAPPEAEAGEPQFKPESETPIPDADAYTPEAAEALAGDDEALQAALERIGELEAELAALREEKATMEAEGLAILDEIARLSDSARASDAARAVAEAESAVRGAEVVALEGRVRILENRIVELEAQRDAVGTRAVAGVGIDRSAFKRVLKSGFSGARSLMGTWAVSATAAAQTDPRQYFSRLSLALSQPEKPVLYAFTVKAGPEGWVGAGLHFFVSGVKREKGYGEGKSLLIWLTRDPKARGDDATYLQLYRSDDDIRMERVLDAELEADVADSHRVEVLYDPADEFVVVAVDGEVKAAYRTFFGIGSGVSVSLRTLGAGVAFKDFEARTGE